MERRVKESDLEAAKSYLRRRVEAETSMSDNLEAVISMATERIVEICYKYGVRVKSFAFDSNPRMAMEIDEVMEWLREAIEDMLYTLAAYADEDNASMIWAWVKRERDGMTFDERLDGYLHNFSREMELLVGAGLFLGLAMRVTADSIKRNLRKPWRNPDLADGITAPLSYGRGKTNSMTTALTDLTRFGVAEGWMKSWEMNSKKSGVIGWEIQRSSSYPCDLCDGNCGFHSIEEGLNLPLHLNCCCIAVKIYSE